MKDNKFKIREKIVKLAAKKKAWPTIIGNMGENHFKENFALGGFKDQNVEKWKPRKVEDAGRAILVKSGDLKRSIRIKSKSQEKIVWGSDLKYAAVHNSGQGKMPKRKFMGKSMALLNKIKVRLKSDIDSAIKK